jgi:hypothetical protein
VWQAPAEGGIPRYMLVFQEKVAGNVGPVRSARYYFIAYRDPNPGFCSDPPGGTFNVTNAMSIVW